MSSRSRLLKLEKAFPAPAPPGEPEVMIWLPRKDGDGGAPPGDYPSPDGRVLTRIYVAEHPPPAT